MLNPAALSRVLAAAAFCAMACATIPSRHQPSHASGVVLDASVVAQSACLNSPDDRFYIALLTFSLQVVNTGRDALMFDGEVTGVMIYRTTRDAREGRLLQDALGSFNPLAVPRTDPVTVLPKRSVGQRRVMWLPVDRDGPSGFLTQGAYVLQVVSHRRYAPSSAEYAPDDFERGWTTLKSDLVTFEVPAPPHDMPACPPE